MDISTACMPGLAHTTTQFNQVTPGLSSLPLPHIIPSDLRADPLTLSSGVIWTALNIDYPGHSFSHLGVFFGSSISSPNGLKTEHLSRGGQRPPSQPGPAELFPAYLIVYWRCSCGCLRSSRPTRISRSTRTWCHPLVGSQSHQR